MLAVRPRRSLLALAASVLVVATLVTTAPATVSAGTPLLSLSESAPATVLYGTPATVTLKASNPSPSGSGAPVYNISFEDVLPLGVSYVPGTSSTSGSGTTTNPGDPGIYPDQPSTGETTLVWANLADLQSNSSQQLTFQVQGQTDLATSPAFGPDPILPGTSYTDMSSVFANQNPHLTPQFIPDPVTGAIVVSGYTDSDTASGTTLVSPLQVTTSEPSPEHELPRGVHDHQVAYTVTVTNNDVHATDGIGVIDYLPAGLEFLGCGGVDNTTQAATLGAVGKLEYAGAPTLASGAPAFPDGCPTPTSVDTVAGPVTTATGTVLQGPLTEVTWTLADLAPSASESFNFAAAVPLQQNTTTWSGAEPTAASLGQASNLDNNSGPETFDGEQLTTTVDASGNYQGATGPPEAPITNPIAAEGSVSVTAVDLALQKSAGSSVFEAGQIVQYMLHYETSEYRYASTPASSLVPPATPENPGVVISDHLPGGTCPVGTGSLVSDPDVDFAGDCAVAPGSPSVPYSSVSENADGSFDATWHLGVLAPNTNATITYPVLDRVNYQGATGDGLAPTAPTLAGDMFTNTASVAGTVNGTCFEGTPTAPTPDPTCSGGAPELISPGESTPGQSTNGSQATQTARAPTILKQISEPAAPGTTMDCSTATYVTPDPPSVPAPSYQQGDTVCFRLVVTFPQGVYTSSPVVKDFLPPNTTYVPGSAVPGSGNTVSNIDSITAAGTSPDSLTIVLGGSVPGDASAGLFVGPGKVFDLHFAAVIDAPPTEGNAYTFTQNLMTLSALSTSGQGISLRSQAGYNVTQPLVSDLSKSVALINGVTPTPGQTVQQGDQITYDVGLTNAGLIDAVNTTVWDNLPAQLSPTDCALVTSISDGGTCVAGTPLQVQWTGITVPAGTVAGGPGAATLSYVLTVPDTDADGETLLNHAGVRSYDSPLANTPGATTMTYYPRNNIDPSVPSSSENAPAADAFASVRLGSPELTKTAAPTINGPGSATIGEPIKYTVTALLPTGATLYGPTSLTGATIDDPLNTNLIYSSAPADATATYDGGALPAGFSLTHTSSDVRLTFPPAFRVPPSLLPGTVPVVITFYATVADNGGSPVAGTTIPNSAAIAWNTSTGEPLTESSNSTSTTVVEPHLTLTKSDAPGGPYAAGATVTYTVTLSNSGSDAHDVVVTDNLPAGMASPTPLTAPAGWTPAVTGSAGSGYTITWTLDPSAAVTAGSPAVFTYSTALPNPVVSTDVFTNTVAATASSLDVATYPGARTTYTASTTDTVYAVGPTIRKVATPSSVTNGVDTTYTVTLTVPANLQFPNATVIDTLPDGMVFDGYGPTSCVDNGTAPPSACSGLGIDIQPIGTPTMDPTTGKTTLAWWGGNILDDASTRVIVLTYQAYPAKFFHNGSSVNAPVTLSNAVGSYWDRLPGTLPTTIPSPSGYDFASGIVSTPLHVIAPRLTITKSASTTSPTPGVPFSYTVTVTNTGTSTAYDPTVSDTIPTVLDLASTMPETPSQGTVAYDAGSGVVTWDMTGTTLAPGASATLEIETVLGPSSSLSNGQVITNTATINHYYGVPVATATADPSRYVTYGPVSGSVSVTPAFPALVVAKSMPSGDQASIGESFPWKLVITDASPAAATSIGTTDTLPAYWTYDAGSTTVTRADGTNVTGADADPTVVQAGNVETLSWAGSVLGDLGANSSNAITITYTATPGDGVAYANTNSASATGDDLTGAPGNMSGPYVSPTVTATAFVQADLSIVKSNASAFVAGSSGTYLLTVSNNGTSNSPGPLIVRDRLPSGESFVSASGPGWTCGNVLSLVTCQLEAGLASGQSSQVSLVVAVASDVIPPGDISTTLTNTATVTGPLFDPVTSNNSSSDVTTIDSSADLSIQKTHDPSDTLTPGTDVHYTLDVANDGPSAANAPTVTDMLPAYLTYVSASGTGWNCGALGLIVTCTSTASVAANTQAEPITLVAQIASGHSGTVANTGSVTSTTPDPDTSNNSSTDTATTGPASADLSIVKTHDASDSLTPGTDIRYSLAVHNAGPSDAADPQVQDDLPSYLTYVSATGAGWTCSFASPTVTCTSAGSLVANASAQQITLVAQIASGHTGTIANTATVSSTTSDPEPSNNTSTDTATTSTPSADLSIVKTHSGADSLTPGTDVHYTLAVHNAGPSDAVNPTVTDVLPAYLTYVTATGVGWTCSFVSPTVTCTAQSNLAANANAHPITLVAGIASGFTGTVSNTASVSSTTPDPDTSNNSSSDSASGPSSADLSIVKTHDTTDSFTPGTNVHYTLAVHNDGPSDAADPTVTDVLPSYLTFVSATGSGWSCANASGTVTCNATGSVVANSDAAPISLVAQIASGFTGTVENTATVSSTTPDPDMSNNSWTDLSTTGPLSADISIVKTHDPTDTFTPGTDVRYTLAVHNAGPSDAADDPQVQDTLPGYLTYVSATGTGWTCYEHLTTVICDASSNLGANSDASPITLVAQIASGYTGPVVNTATVSSTTPDPNLTNNTSTDTAATTAPMADLSILKTHDPDDSFAPGTEVNYTLAVTNAGPSDAADPVVTDVLPGYLTYVSASGPGWTCGDAGPTVTCTATAPLPASSGAEPITLVAQIASGYLGTVSNTASVTSATEDPDTSNNSSTDSSATVPSADLSIVKTHGADDPLTPGTDVHYTLAVHNAGPSDAADPVVTDVLPGYLTYVSASGPGWNCANASGTVTCDATAGLVADTDAEPISLVAQIASGFSGTIDNTATVSSTTPDPDTSNNASTDSAASGPPSADLAIVKSHVGDFTGGMTGTYQFAVSNLGPSDAANPVVTDDLPSGMTFDSSSGAGWSCSAAGQIVTCTLGSDLVAGEEDTALAITVAVAPNVPPGTLTNFAIVSSTTHDPDLTNNTASDPTVILAPSLTLTKQVTSISDSDTNGITGAGDVISYELVATNVGTAPATHVTIDDPLLPALYCEPGQPADLAPGADLVCSGSYTVTPADVTVGHVANTASVSGYNESGQLIPGASASTSTPTGNEPTITKSNTPTTAAVGDNSTYTVDVSILPNTRLFNLSAIDRLPDGLTFGALTGSTCTNADATPCAVAASLIGPTSQSDGSSLVNFYLGDAVAAATQARVVAITYTAHAAKTFAAGGAVGPGTVLTNTVGTYWNASQQATPTTSTLPTDFDAHGGTASSSLTVTAPALAITKSVSNPTPGPGDQFTYTVTVANGAGPTVSPAYGVTVTDAVPAGLAEPTDISDGGTFAAGGSGAGTITWHVSDPIGAGDSVTRTYVDALGPSGSITPGQPLVNTASVTQYFDSRDGQGGNPSRYNTYAPVAPDLTATATVTPQFPSLSITKTTASGAPSGVAELGMPFGWVVTVTNPSGPTASGVQVTDTLPPGWTYDVGSTVISGPGSATSHADPAVVVAATGDTLTWSGLGTLQPPQSVAIAFTATPSAEAILGSANPNTNAASATWTDASGASGTQAGPYAAGPATATATVDAADMAITKTHTGNFPVGSTATFTLTATNNGPNPAAGVVVTDDLPAGLTPTSVTPANPANWTCSITGQTVACEYALAAFAVGASEQISVAATVGESAYPSVTNTAVVSSTTPDQDPTNNSASDTATVTRPELALVKRVIGVTDVNHDGYNDEGDIIKYQLVATNVGDAVASDVTIADPLLASLSCAPGQPATLAPGQQLACKGSHTITAADVAAGEVRNTATAHGKDGAGKPITSRPASTVTPTKKAPAKPPTGGGSGGGGENGSPGTGGGGGLAFTGGPTLATMGGILAILLVGVALLMASRRRPAHARRRRR